MPYHSTREILERVRNHTLPVSRAERFLKLDSLAIVGEIARLDMNRGLRRGVPEIVFAESKSTEQLEAIVRRLVSLRFSSSPQQKTDAPIILSKLRPEHQNFLVRFFRRPAFRTCKIQIFPSARIALISDKRAKKESATSRKENPGRVALLGAGTSDIPATTEARVVVEAMRCSSIEYNDVGIASLKRLRKPLTEIAKFDPDALIVAAGMEAALPSLIAGLSTVPVIGLPTSVGYGYGGKGEAALMSMLQACPLGICVVNIDGGVAAGVIAAMIANRCADMRAHRRGLNMSK